MDIIASHRANKDFRKFWKSTNNLNVKPSLPISVDEASRPEDIANLFKEHFRVQSPLGPSNRVNCAENVRGKPLISLTAKEISHTIRNMTRGKSPGHDSLSIEHLQMAGVHLPRVLSLLFTFCIRHAYLPQDMMKTVVVPIVKNKRGNVSDKSNYRPISLATIIAKVLDGLLCSQLDSHLHLHDAQFGFRLGVSTEAAILGLKHTVKYYTDRRTPVYACFLDLSKAFDMVSYDILWQKLSESNLPQELQNVFRYWYNNQINVVKWNNSFSDSYRLECGVRQGGLTSPALFSLYVNGLIERLSKMHVGCYIDGLCINNISYADDMVLLSPSVSALRKMLAVCESYAESHGLIYNSKKSEFIVFEAGGKCPDTVPPILLCGSTLNRVYEFKYLGHIITADLKDDRDIERERRALAVRINMLSRRFARCSKQVKITLFKAYCQVLYTSSLWVNYTQKAFNALRVQYNNAFRMMLGLPRFCSASGMFATERTDDFYAIRRKRVASLLSRVRGSGNSILKTISDKVDCPILKFWVGLLIK